MGLKITGVGATAFRLENLHKGKVGDASRRAMEKGAKAIQGRARRQAPYLDGALESAIEIDDSDYKGIHGRKRFTIYIDESRPLPGRPGKTIGDYAVRMHEGTYQLGERSRDKQSSNSDVTVGRKFLERAADDMRADITRQVMAAIKSAL